MNDWEAGTSRSATEDFDVFLNHRGPNVKATFVAHLEDALRGAGFRPFLDARSLMKGNPALQSIDQALAMAKVHVAVVSRGYAQSKYCLTELVAMMRSGKPVVPVFYDVEPVDLRWVEKGPFAEAFENHVVKRRSEKEVQEWKDALRALADLTGFRLADYKRDEAKLKQKVVDEVRRLTPSNDLVDVEQYRVGLEGPSKRCIQALEKMGDRIGMLSLVGMVLAMEEHAICVCRAKYIACDVTWFFREYELGFIVDRGKWRYGGTLCFGSRKSYMLFLQNYQNTYGARAVVMILYPNCGGNVLR